MPQTSRPMVRIHNTETDEILDREMNDEEFAEYEKYKAEKAQAELVANQRELNKAELLERLGLSAYEAALLLS